MQVSIPGGWARVLALMFLALALAGPAAAAPVFWGGEPAQGTALVDPDGAFGAQEALERMARGQGEAFDPDAFYPLAGNTAVWLRVKVPLVPAVLALPHPGLNRIDLFSMDAQGLWQVQHSGDALPVADWALPALYPAFVVDRPPADGGTVLLRVAHNHPVSLPLRVWPKAQFDRATQWLLLLLGGYLGFIGLVIAVNLFNYVVWHDRLQLANAIYVLAIGATQASLTGLGGLFLWPHSPRWNDLSPVVLPLLGVVAAGWFTHRVIQGRAPRGWNLALLAYCVLGLLLAGAFFVLDRGDVFTLANYFFLLCTPLCLAAMGAYARRHPVGWWFVAGFAVLFLGAVFAVLRNLEWMPMSFVTQWGAQIGAALEIPLLLVGLHLRGRERRDNQARMNTLSRVDPTTGLVSHRVLLERLEQRLARGGAVALLRIRVGNARQLREDYGQEVLDAALVHAGACIGRFARESDTVARHRDGDFLLMLGLDPTREAVAEVGQRIIARGLAHTATLPERQVLKLLVAAAVPPLAWNEGEGLLEALAEIVEEMQARGGKALRLLDSWAP